MMEIEQLKLIVGLIAQLGEQGKEAFILYLAATKGLGFVEFVIGAAVTAYLLHRAIAAIANNGIEEDRLRAIRNALSVGTPGRYTDSEHTKVMLKIQELQK